MKCIANIPTGWYVIKMSRTAVSGKEKILNAALSVIRCKGYEATTVDDLCASAGVTKGAFFHHFKSKEEMAVEAANHWSRVTNQLFDSAPYRKIPDPLNRVLGYVDFRKSILQGELAEFTCLVGTMVQETYDSSSPIRDACARSIFGHAADVAKDIEAAKKLYAPKAKWSAESLAHYIQSVLQGSFILAKAKNNSDVAGENIAHLRRYIEFLFNKEKK
jgi:TetR/AcrR family transcriptional regulator, transcriptional repressor for nem operon